MRVNTPDGPADFPDTMSEADVEAALQKLYPPKTPTLAGQVGQALSSADQALGGWPSAAGKMAANVAPNIAVGGSDAMANAANKIAGTLESYGLASPSPTIVDKNGQTIQTGRIPSASGAIKEAAEVPQFEPGSLGSQTEGWLTTAGQLAAGNAGGLTGVAKNFNWGSLVPSTLKNLTRGAIVDALGQGASYVGGEIANAVDPRLKQLGEVFGPVAAFQTPWESVGSATAGPLGLRASNAGETYDAAKAIADQLNLPETPVTAGVLGSRPVKALESMLNWIPGANVFTTGAQKRMQEAVPNSIEASAQSLAPGQPLATEPGGPGSQLQMAAKADLNQRWSDAKSQMDAIESNLSNQATPTGEMRLVPLQALTQELNALRTKSFGGRTYNIAGSAQDNAISNIIDNLSSKATPEDMALHQRMNGIIAANQNALGAGNLSPALAQAAQMAINRANAAKAANMKVPFEAVRAEKSNVGAALEGDNSLDYRTDKSMYDALANQLQTFADQSGQGPAYQTARGAYTNAMDTRDMLKTSLLHPVGEPVSPGVYRNPPGATDLTNSLTSLLKNPERGEPLATQPYFPGVAASTLGRLGIGPRGEFDPRAMANQWNTSTQGGRDLLTGGNQAVQGQFGNAATLANAVAGGSVERPRLNENIAHGATVASMLAGLGEHVLNHGLLHAAPILTGAGAGGYMLENPATLRALAGRPNPWATQMGQNMPAVMSVLAQQGRLPGQ